jgi:transposase
MFSYISLESRVPKEHPLRPIKALVDEALRRLSPSFDKLYDRNGGRHSIPPEQLIRALLLQILYTIRSERQLVEQLDFNLLFRWFVGLEIDEAVWNHSTFSRNRDRLLAADIASGFFREVVDAAWERDLISVEHFTVDGTLIQAWASQKSFQRDPAKTGEGGGDGGDGGAPAGRNAQVNFHGERRSNATHTSTSDPDAMLAKKSAGGEAKLSHAGHLVTENRSGLIVGAVVTKAEGTAERTIAPELVDGIQHRKEKVTVGGDKGYDTTGGVEGLRAVGATPHVAQRKKGSAIDGRTTSWDGYEISQVKRKLVEQCFGWMKTVGPMRQTKYRGTALVDWIFLLSAATYNLVRIRNLTLAKCESV